MTAKEFLEYMKNKPSHKSKVYEFEEFLDRYYEALGEEIEKYPIGRKTPRGCA